MENFDLDIFRVVGTTEEEETGRPLANLIVRAFDRDLIFDDKVGYATTDDDGRFEIRFNRQAFQDFLNRSPISISGSSIALASAKSTGPRMPSAGTPLRTSATDFASRPERFVRRKPGR